MHYQAILFRNYYILFTVFIEHKWDFVLQKLLLE